MTKRGLNQHKKFLARAVKLAKQKMLAGEGGPFGALIVKNGRVIAEGFNRVTSAGDPTLHAEVDAIRKACSKLKTFELKDCVIYASCEPCPMCLGAVYWARPKALFFAATKETAAAHGFDDGFIYDEISRPYNKRAIKTQAVAIENFEEPFIFWDKKEDRKEY